MLTRGLVVVASLLMLAACAPAVAPTPTTAPKPAIAPAAPTSTAVAPAAPKAAAATPAATASSAPTAKPAAKSSALQELIEGARKEGTVRAGMSGDLGERGAQRMADAFNKKYGLNLKVEISLPPSMRAMGAQIMTELQTGGEPSYDVLHAFVIPFAPFIQGEFLASYDWAGTFPDVPKEAVQMNGTLLVMDSTLYVPAYNTNLVKPADLPKKWDDFLDPKWKGNLLHHNTAIVWAKFVEIWGEARATAFVEALAKQEPVFAQAYQVAPKISSGEYPITPYVLDSGIVTEQQKGAPIRPIDELKPQLVEIYQVAVPKKAKYPNAARLFAGFQLSPEAQTIWWEEIKRGAPFGTGPAAQRLKTKEIFISSDNFQLKELSALDQKYRKILGLQ